MTADTTQEKTSPGNYFVANYPPFSAWKPAYLQEAETALRANPEPATPLGLYLHIPFCRKRCKFCYFRVYTDKNARDVETYLDALTREVELYARLSVADGRPVHFVYFGGGTPSYLSAAQLGDLFTRLQAVMPWDQAAEVTFECEPGTLQEHKLRALKEKGVTRLSLGIENFNDKILESNGRAHLSSEIFRAYRWARDLGFDQINIDLIAGMVGETWDNWRDCVKKTIDLAPESVTIYQMELPFNTVFTKELNVLGSDGSPPVAVADWATKRAWVAFAFDELEKAGYEVSSGYTMVRDRRRTKFVYRDSLWHGADMLGTGVASFGHVHGVHVQNVDAWETYVEMLQAGKLPLGRALPLSPRQRLIRETILQLKTGRLEARYFQEKFGVNVRAEFEEAFGTIARDEFAVLGDDITLTRKGLLQVDRLLPAFFEAEFRGGRYT